MNREDVIKGLYEIHAYFRDSVNAMRGGTADCTVFNRWAMTVTDALALIEAQREELRKLQRSKNWAPRDAKGEKITVNVCPTERFTRGGKP